MERQGEREGWMMERGREQEEEREKSLSGYDRDRKINKRGREGRRWERENI